MIALAVATAAAMALLWPGDVETKLGAGLATKTEPAEVVAVAEFACSGFRTSTCRRVRAVLKDGPEKGRAARLMLGAGAVDPPLDVGDEVRLARTAAPPGADVPEDQRYTLADFERRQPMLLLALAFVLLVVVFGRLRGALSLVGLGISLAILLLFVVPAILDGKEPLVVAVVGSLAVMLVTITLAHGTGPKSVAAMLGTASSLVLTVALALAFTKLTHLTGLSSEEATLLQLNDGAVSFEGLLLAGMVIGALGVLDDVTVSQASTVLALRRTDPSLPFRELFSRAVDVGRDHVTATVNTLALAYVGASLPLLLIFSSGTLGFADAVNVEVVAKEVVATLVGSIGLIAAVPVTTALAAWLARATPPERLPEAAGGHVH